MNTPPLRAGRNGNRGFTLAEIVIVVGLATILFGALSYIYVGFVRTYPRLDASLSITAGAGAITDATHEAGLQATRVVTSHVFSGITYASGGTVVVFELPAIDSAGAIVSGAYDYIGIYASGNEAYSITDADPASSRIDGTKKLTDTLAELSFTYDTPNPSLTTSVHVAATTSAVVRDETITFHTRTFVPLRNL